MSKKHKSKRKPLQKPVKKVAAPPTAMKKTNGRQRPAAASSVHPRVVRAPVPTVQPAAAADGHRALPFWARMPFAIADFWFSRREPRAR
jgi:hypothetical protein